MVRTLKPIRHVRQTTVVWQNEEVTDRGGYCETEVERRETSSHLYRIDLLECIGVLQPNRGGPVQVGVECEILDGVFGENQEYALKGLLLSDP